MSNIIPMVSSSPPPLDEVPSFTDAWEEEDDDDFGNFTGADTLNDIPDYNQCALPSPSKDSSSISLDTDIGLDNDQTDRDICNNSAPVVEIQKKPTSLDLPCTTSNNQRETENGSVSTEINENTISESGLSDSININKRGSTTDSGMCSTEISPIPLSDEISNFSDSKCTVTDTEEMFTEIETPDSIESIHDTPINEGEQMQSETVDETHGSTENITDLPEEKEKQESTENFSGVDTEVLQLPKENLKESQESAEDKSNLSVTIETSGSTENVDGSSSVDVSSIPLNNDSLAATSEEESSSISDIGLTNSEQPKSEDCKSTENSDENPSKDSVDGDDNDPENWSDFSDFTQVSENHDQIKSTETVCISSSPDNHADSIENSVDKPETDSNINHNDDDNETNASKVESQETVDKPETDFNMSHNDDDDNESTASKIEPQENTCAADLKETTEVSTSEAVSQNPVDDSGGFADFPVANSESDNWADFASFPSDKTETETSITPVTEDRTEIKSGATVNEDSEDFADFKTVHSQDDFNNFQGKNDFDNDGDDFGDFRTVENIDDDFNDFTEPQETSAKESSRTNDWSKHGQHASHARLKAPIPEKIVGVLDTCFPVNSKDLVSLNQLNEILDNIMETSRPLRVPHPARYKYKQTKNVQSGSGRDVENIWQYLRDIEKSTAVKYQWAESSGNKKLFSTLKIDARNVLNCGVKKPGIPIYAANLGLLEPTRGEQKQAEEGKKVVTSLVDTSKSDNTTTTLQEDIPPAQFDWSGSGLTNPLGAQSSLLDLDLLAVNEGKSDGDGKGKAQSDEWEWVFESDALGGSEKLKLVPKTLKPLEMVLASMKFNPTIKQVKTDEKLTSEATKIINSLPDLSFMQAKVLMFPVRSMAEEGLNGGS